VRPEGHFVWTEIITPDKEKSIPFFKKVLGWVNEGDEWYFQMKAGGHLVGAMCEEPDKTKPKKEHTFVNVYIGVNSVDEIAERVKHFGGTVVKDPFDVMDKGRMATFLDPDGAEFNVWQGNTHTGIPKLDHKDMPANGFPCWFELNAKDKDRSIQFYTKVFGWEYYTKSFAPNMEYTVFFKDEVQVAGLIQMTPEWGNLPPHWMTYFLVENIDETVKIAKELGGITNSKPSDIPGMKEKMCLVKDPTGIPFQVMGYVDLDKKEWIFETLDLKHQVSKGDLKISKLERKIKHLEDVLKKHQIEYENDEHEEKVELKKSSNTLKRKLSQTESKENKPDTKKRKKN